MLSRNDKNAISHNNLYLQGYAKQWGESLTQTVGLSFTTGLSIGGVFGIVHGFSKPFINRRLQLNSILNSSCIYGPKLGNRFAVFAILHFGINSVAKRKLSHVPDSMRTTLAGALSGYLYCLNGSSRLKLAYVTTSSDFTAGGISAAISKTLVAPLERVKLLLQLQDTNTSNKVVKYTGIFNCLYRVSTEQGILSLWRGNLANCLRYFPTQAFNFLFKDFFKFLFPKYDKDTQFMKFLSANVLSGGLAGAVSQCIVYPLDFARTRLATDLGVNATREFKGLFDCLYKISKISGPASLYQGFAVSVQGIIVYRGVYFGLYDTSKAYFFNDKNKNNFLKRFILAQGITTTAGFIAYPFDTVRRRMMMMAGRNHNILYKNTFDCWRKIARQEGISSFFKGSMSNAFRGIGGALVLVLYDELQKILY